MATILVVEDDLAIRSDIVDLLDLEGYHTIGAENGQEGLTLARQHFPDLILSDVMMPEVDGYEMLRQLQNDPSTAIIPFLFLTAKAEHKDIRKGMDLGADDYLTKPFTSDELLRAVSTRLTKYESTTKHLASLLTERRSVVRSSSASDDSGSLIGHTIRGYQFTEIIGEGSTGMVYLAHQPSVGRQVAIKVLHQRFAEDNEFVHRFQAEAELVARLEHPHIIPLYDFWHDADGIYIVMRWLRAGSLRTILFPGAGLEPLQVARFLDQIASALSIAHNIGIIHRDMKPGNILLDEYDNIYLTDFGLAKNLVGGAIMPRGEHNLQKLIEQQEEFFEIAPLSTLYITDNDGLMGTPAYLAPEQIENAEAYIQSDVYSLGITLYEMLTGNLPFAGTVEQIIIKHLTVPLPSLGAHRPDLSRDVDDVLQTATHKDWRQRYDNVLAFAAEFRAAINA